MNTAATEQPHGSIVLSRMLDERELAVLEEWREFLQDVRRSPCPPSVELRAALERAVDVSMASAGEAWSAVCEMLIALSFALDDIEHGARVEVGARETDDQIALELRAVADSSETHPHGQRALEIMQSSSAIQTRVRSIVGSNMPV